MLFDFGKARLQIDKRLEDYINAGVTYSLGQVSQKRLQTIEMMLGNIPRWFWKNISVAANAQKQLGDGILSTAKNLIKKPVPKSTTVVGRTIVNSLDGVNNTKSFVGLFNGRTNTLFGKLDNYLSDKLIDLSKNDGKNSTLNTIAKLVDDILDAKNVDELIKKSIFKRII